jgi:hypothetical protein
MSGNSRAVKLVTKKLRTGRPDLQYISGKSGIDAARPRSAKS